MSTRFYFTSDALTGIGVPTVTADASWEQFGSLRSWLSSRKLGSGFTSRALAETSTSGTYDSCQQQFVSKPLAAQTISGTVKAIMRCAESNAAADMRSQMLIKVVSGDGGTVRGTLLAHDASALSNEWYVGSGVALQNRKFPLNWGGAGATLTPVVAQAGDRLVVEIGNRAHNTSATQYYGYIETGDGAANDCAENETDTLQYNPWIEFSQNLVFQEDLSRGRGSVEGLISAGSERKPLSQKSVQFGGTDEYVTMGDVLGFERTDSFSISFWVRTSSSSPAWFVGKSDPATTWRAYGVYLWSTGEVRFYLRSDFLTSNEIIVETVSAVNDGRWHHVVCAYGGLSLASDVAIYIDGLPASLTTITDNLTATILSSGAFCLGSAASVGYYEGNLDEVAVYNKKLSADEVKMLSRGYYPSVVASSNLAGYWKMGDGDTHPTLLDSSHGYRNILRAEDRSTGLHHGTYAFVGLSDLTTDTPGGISKFSLTGNGTKYVTVGDYLNYPTASPFSLSAWVKYTNTNWESLIGKRGGVNYTGYLLCTAGGPLGMILRDSGGTYIQAVTLSSFNDGNWHHVVGTWDGGGSVSGMKLYVDGVLQGLATTGTTVGEISNSYTLALASSPAGAFALVGSIDEPAVYNKTLSLSEVQAIYNSGAPTDLTTLSSASNLTGWWPLGEGSASGTMVNMESSDIGYDVPLLPVWDVRGYDVKAAPDLGTTSHDYETVRVPDFAMASGTTVEPGGGVVTYYKMRAQDSGASPPGYVSWVVQDDPDFAGAGYSGGSPTPVGPFVPGSIVVAAEWQE